MKTEPTPIRNTENNRTGSATQHGASAVPSESVTNDTNNRQPYWQTLSPQEASAQLESAPGSGLSPEEAGKRLQQFGPNRLGEEKREPLWEVFFEEVREPLILLLITVGVLYAFLGELSDSAIIFGVILFVVGSEVFNEQRAHKAISALHRLAEHTAAVRRGGSNLEVPAEEIVPGDLLLLEAGRRVPADARLIESYSLAVDESALTGEAVPTEKEADITLPADTPLAERHNLIYSGTTVSRGKGSAVVVGTGKNSELGRVSTLTREVKSPRTPLQVTMRELSRWMVWLAIGFSVVVPLVGWLVAGQPLQEMLLTGLSLAFATIPEELPILITVVLALGAYRLSQQHAIVKRLQAVETLGSVNVIATDKTGTLTENRMQVDRLEPPALAPKLLEIGVLCNDAIEGKDGDYTGYTGDPLETALLRAAQEAGVDVAAVRRAYPLREEFTFDNNRKMMSAVYERDDMLWSTVKGAPEQILSRAARQLTIDGEHELNDVERQAALASASEMSAKGLRVIALAEKRLPIAIGTKISQDNAESDLTFVGLVALADPPRPEAKEAIAACRAAGIRPLMITGDHPLTAKAIGEQVGLDVSGGVLTGPELDAMPEAAFKEAVERVSIYARTTPEHKLRIVGALQERGHRVAVTGDGINDGPALAAADIGVAMGETGTDVAREAADIVLADDNFATIVRAIREGRVLFGNLRKSVRYYLACKVALISATLLPVLLGVPVPLAPIQIILTELFMDLAASATFVVEPAESDLMRQPPRPSKARFMDAAMVSSIFISAAGLFAAVATGYLLTFYGGASLEKARTVAFVTWLLGHVLLAFNLRSEREPLFRLGLFSNRLMLLWAAATIVFILLITFVPWVQAVLKTTSLNGQEWALAVGLSVAGTFWLELRKLLFYRNGNAGPRDGG